MKGANRQNRRIRGEGLGLYLAFTFLGSVGIRVSFKKGSRMATDFLEFLATTEKPVLADFWAEWCGPCKMMAPVLKELAHDWKGRLTVVKVNTDERPALAQKFQISGIPTLILFKHGKEVHRSSGAMPLAQLKREFEGKL
jgi:thioredoxin 1